ncbi:MAG: S8 family serine peptidase [Promethearchaeati archaeon]
MKKSKYCILLLMVLIFPLCGYLIQNNLYDFNRDIKLADEYNAQNYIGLKNDLSEGLTGDGINVAVIDTGIDADHEVFISWEDRITYFDVVENESIPEDNDGHGTWVASILGGNSLDYKGVAPDVNFTIIRAFFEDEGERVSNIGLISDAVDVILQKQEDLSIRIVSMSFGIESASQQISNILNSIVEQLVDNNILAVAAAGNDGDGGLGTIQPPASSEKVLAIGGVYDDGEPWPLSSKGPSYDHKIKPDVCAPAVNIKGASASTFFTNRYTTSSGTSASTPFISGLAALMLEKDNDLTALELKSIISLTSYRTIDPRIIKDNIQGWGVVQGYAALDALDSPIEINSNSNFAFTLNESQPVLCLPVKTTGLSNYFLQLNQLDTAEAEMYLFDTQPDDDGNPQLLTHSISAFEPYDTLNRIGISSIDSHNYYLTIKLVHGTGSGDFSIIMVMEYRLSLFLIIVGVNLLGLVFIGFQYKKFQKVDLR